MKEEEQDSVLGAKAVKETVRLTTAFSAPKRTCCLCFKMSTMSSTPSASTKSCLQAILTSGTPTETIH